MIGSWAEPNVTYTRQGKGKGPVPRNIKSGHRENLPMKKGMIHSSHIQFSQRLKRSAWHYKHKSYPGPVRDQVIVFDLPFLVFTFSCTACTSNLLHQPDIEKKIAVYAFLLYKPPSRARTSESGPLPPFPDPIRYESYWTEASVVSYRLQTPTRFRKRVTLQSNSKPSVQGV